MRLHRLEVTAFGPFADAVTVDFDDLSAANVFLLCGDTGAGKSTVLDAVCFALYGDVPSDRGAARQLRSQHAADGVAPRVVLETTVAGRRFRFTRSPGWQRPKKRGTGLTPQQPTVLVEEQDRGGAWVVRTTRLDEAGHLVGDLLGMNLDQFSQVVLLPQGRFDTFLRSSSEERQRLLTQLFRTRRFEDVERWLAERRVTLRRASDAHRTGVENLLHRLSETADADVPDWDLALAAEAGEVGDWSSGLVREALADVAEGEGTLASAAASLEVAVEAHDAGRRTADLLIQHAAAVRTLARLAVQADAAEHDRVRLDAGRRAAVVAPLAAVARRTSSAAESAREGAARALAAVGDVLDTSVESLAVRADQASVHAALVREFVPRARELGAASATATGLDTRIAAAVSERGGHAAWLEVAPAGAASLAGSAESLEAVVAAGATAQSEVTRLAKQLSQLAIADELAHMEVDAKRRRDEQRRVLLDLRHELHEIHESRLAGMAGELAGAMAVGADCPVCGSHDHPRPATSAPNAPTKDDEQVLRGRIDDADVTLVALDDANRGYRERLVAVRAELGDATPSATTAGMESARDALTAAREAERELPAAREALTAWQAETERRTAEVGRLDTGLAADRASAAAARERVAALTGELAALVGDDPAYEGPDALASLAEASERTARALTDARDSLLARESAEQAEREALDALTDSAREHGFVDVGAAEAAEVPPRELDRLAERLETHDRERSAAEQVLADPGVAEAVAGDPPDVGRLSAKRAAATAEHGAAVAAVRVARQRATRLETRATELAAALAAWAPARIEHERVRALSELAEGRGPDNPRQVRLSAYVLAARLGEVVAAANERLVRMYDDRFLLEHTADRGVGERRGGLSLVVRDQWTDEVRDPVTLSGGETFVVSLALALGLADVVTAEAGGTPVDTLFVDEGFGSLDADTLELVMDTLDQLREGGRVVGLVSHVPEMRSRIPAQLLVSKGRHGSTLEQRIGVG